ncbi:hypothetical protein LKO26_03285 [Chryseobacterium sp. MFBS3-17]|nr:hypothetical protein [Chryseobacterium sp. MFBS3-17]
MNLRNFIILQSYLITERRRLILGYLRIMFRVRNLDEMVMRLQEKGYELEGEMVNYENIYCLCYSRGAEGILVGLAERLT